MDLLKGELDSSNKTYATSTVDGNEANEIEADRVLDITEEGDHDPMTITAIKTESGVPVVSSTYISYRLYREFPTRLSFYPREINILR